MSHPTLWPRMFFYPVGNTPAVCLTKNIPPEKSANVLLLGCGDPRNILYTLHADPPTQRPSLDVTCCDIEPAVIARNVLLLTLIYDGHESNRIWDIFYHIKIDQAAFALLISQSKKLLDASRDLDTWKSSRYSGFLQFRSRYTLSRVRHYLELYVQTESYSRAKHEQLFSPFTHEFALRRSRDDIIPDLARSAGPFLMEALQILSNHNAHYWRTGTVSRSAADITAATFVNPTFVYSESFVPSLVGDSCSLHYATYPLQSFHLASAFLAPSPPQKQLVSCARSQFRDWCSTFRVTVSSTTRGQITIRMLAGDALAFCRTLFQSRNPSSNSDRVYVSAWNAAELLLDGDISSAPTGNFDIIDTSNLPDHVGLLNVLIATVPLLAHSSTSVLYTEVALKKGPAGEKASNFEELLCTDIPTIAVLLGIAPAGSISQYSSVSQVHEIILMADSYRDRILWKRPYPADFHISGGEAVIPSFSDPVALAARLFSIYKHMFADEEIAQLMNRTRIAQDIVHYNRGTFVALLGLVKSRVLSDWEAVMDHVFQRLHADRSLILGTNYYQELCCQLYLRGVCRVEALGPQHATPVPIDRTKGLFKGWKEVPSVVCLVLVIPRQKIRLLEGEIGRNLGSPMFQCELRGRNFHNIFSCIQAVLGTASIRGSGSAGQVSITEDAAGWSGTSPLIISVFVPAFNLVFDPQSTKVYLGLHSTPATSILYVKLSPPLTFFAADVMDKVAVYITTNRPNCSPSALILPSIPAPIPSRTQVNVGLNGSSVSTMTARWEITPEELKAGLAGAKVEHQQTSPSIIRNNFVYPFPVRIARKSGWIEIDAPLRSGSSSTLADWSGTSILDEDRRPVLWNIHRVNLESLPIIEGKACLDRLTSTVQSHCSFAFSDRESALTGPINSKPVLVQVKETIALLFKMMIESNRPPAVLLSDPETGNMHILIYCNGIRMDLSSHTFVVDACVLTLTNDLMRGPLGSKVVYLVPQGMRIGGDEVEAWKHLLVAFTERCRSWSHTPTCKYAISGQVPASSSLCGCGEGIELGRASLDPQWKEIAPLMTRAAISPLFALAYLETVHQRVVDKMATFKSQKRCAACQKPELANSNLLKCSRCKEVEYCGKDCQRGHWKEHKKICKTK
ncbi:hypothetical protein B0H17DRAFT_1056261 [Mycena rosella]|uniref:MYND-type domain-containing protein n=1 Tax=Mycena rosella TaxID=1033263 RepID=A0AAD7GLR9_MYCRO|nr:hypothetical protein B0H17DRAFT_1056261 [Mycena rosella]